MVLQVRHQAPLVIPWGHMRSFVGWSLIHPLRPPLYKGCSEILHLFRWSTHTQHSTHTQLITNNTNNTITTTTTNPNHFCQTPLHIFGKKMVASLLPESALFFSLALSPSFFLGFLSCLPTFRIPPLNLYIFFKI